MFRLAITFLALTLPLQAATGMFGLKNPCFSAVMLGSHGTTTYTTNYVTNTWAFTVAELADQGNSSSFGLDSGTSVGLLQIGSTANTKSEVEVGLTNSNTHTWQTWGVPTTGTVVGVCLAGWEGAIRRTNKLTGIGWRLAILNVGSNALHSSTWLYETNPARPWTTNLGAVATLSVSNAWIGVLYSTNQVSTAPVRLQFVIGATNGSSSVLWTNVFDNIKVGIKYYGSVTL